MKKEKQNGSMAEDYEEVQQLGKQMEKMRTESELLEDEMLADPAESDAPLPVKQRNED